MDDIILGIESGQGDLTLRVFDKSGDEIGQLANGVNHFIGTLQNLMVKIQSASKDMKDSSYLVQSEAESSNMNASNVSAASEELAASMEEVSASLYDLAQGCNDLLEKMSGMNEDAKDSAMKLHKVKTVAEDSYKDAMASKEKTVETFGGIQKGVVDAVEASKSVNEISELTEKILNIAAQTNLLALNASIEAARAGEAGKGFAVVASEISALADQTQEATVNIAELIGNISEELTEVVNVVSYLIDNNKLQSIAATETASSFETIASRTQDIHQLTEELTGLVSSLAQSNEAIVDSIQTISAATEEVTAHSSVTLESSEENSSIVVEVGDIVEELQALAERLSALS